MNASVQFPHAAGLTLPDFLGIGAQKAGTSWLHANLKTHPGVFVPVPKELHFFDRRFEEGWEAYGRAFAPAGSRIKGEITPAYGILPPHRVAVIAEAMPRLKVIFLMRNPIERAWSQALMNLAYQPGRAPQSVGDGEIIAHFHSSPSRMRGDYEAILKTWLGHFDRRQVFVGFYEDVKNRPRQLLGEVFSFLGLKGDLDFSAFPCDEVIHGGAGVAMPMRFRRILLEIYQEPIRRLGQLYGAPAEKWLTLD